MLRSPEMTQICGERICARAAYVWRAAHRNMWRPRVKRGFRNKPRRLMLFINKALISEMIIKYKAGRHVEFLTRRACTIV